MSDTATANWSSGSLPTAARCWASRRLAAISEPSAGAGTTADCRYNYATGTYQSVGKLDDFWQHDLNLRVDLPWETTATLGVQNILDTDPPFAQSYYNYDVTNGNPLGRVFKVGLKKSF